MSEAFARDGRVSAHVYSCHTLFISAAYFDSYYGNWRGSGARRITTMPSLSRSISYVSFEVEVPLAVDSALSSHPRIFF